MWYYIVACYVEDRKLFAVYPMSLKIQAPDVDKVIAYFVQSDNAEQFVKLVLKGMVY